MLRQCGGTERDLDREHVDVLAREEHPSTAAGRVRDVGESFVQCAGEAVVRVDEPFGGLESLGGRLAERIGFGDEAGLELAFPDVCVYSER